VDKSVELLTPLEEIRMGAVDRPILKALGDPPKAPPARTDCKRFNKWCAGDDAMKFDEPMCQ